MRQQNFFIAILLMLLAAAVITSCNKNDDTDDQEYFFNLDKYFELEEGNIFGSSFPEASDTSARPVIELISGNSIIPNGGKNSFTVRTSKPVTSIYIGVLNESRGYYGISAPNNEATSTLSFSPDFIQNPDDKFYFLKIAAVDEEGFISDYDSIKIVTLEAALGEMTVACTWDQDVDIDLYLIEPLGDTIFFNNPVSDYNGRLNHDSNPFCWIDGLNEESIFYDMNSAIQTGTYTVLLRYLSSCEAVESVNYSVSVYFNQELMTITGQNPVTGTFTSENTSNNPFELFSFSVATGQKSGTTKHVAIIPGKKAESLTPEKQVR